MQYDVFISHASEDKDGFVRDLAHALNEQRLQVWYDEFSLTVGDSVRRSIDHGLTRSRFGVVVLSSSFFAKQWTEWELDGLVIRHLQGGGNVVLPIWHGLGHSEVAAHSPSLAGIMAIPSSLGIDEVVRRLLRVIRPQGSTLVTARDLAMSYGLDVPVATDDYWLYVAEWAGAERDPAWTFPLPSEERTPQERGLRLGWAALQWSWIGNAEERRLHPLSPPDDVLGFIEEEPGLMEACLAYPDAIADHAPLLTLRGVGGALEEAFDHALAQSIRKNSRFNPRQACDKRWCLRHEGFADREPNDVAHFISSAGLSVYPIDLAAWLLSDASTWLPPGHRDFLRRGVKSWHAWPNWDGNELCHLYEHRSETHFDMLTALHEGYEAEERQVTEEMRAMVKRRLEASARELHLPEDAAILARRFVDEGFVESWFAVQDEYKRRREEREA